MPLANPDEWCLFCSSPCLSSAEWAAWAQAGLSAAAVIAAIAVVWWQIHLKKRQDFAAARLIASGILASLSQTTGGLQSLIPQLAEGKDGKIFASNDLSNLAIMIATLPRPSLEELLVLATSLPVCAVALNRTSGALRQISDALTLLSKMATEGGDAAVRQHHYPYLYDLAVSANDGFASALNELDAFVPE